MTYFEIKDTKWAEDLQSGLEEYMTILQESVYGDDDESVVDVETVSGMMFCGCDTCYYREILCYLTPKILEGGLERKVLLTRE